MTKEIVVLDTEGDGLAYRCTKLHVMSWTTDGKTINSTPDYDEMREVILKPNRIFVAHNIVDHDLITFWRILGLTEDQINYTHCWDSLWMSRNLFPDRGAHGLGYLGKEFGIKKPEVDDWVNLSYDAYKHRCEEDVKINWAEYMKQKSRLEEIYGCAKRS